MLEDRYLTNEQKDRLCNKYVYDAFPDRAIKETAKTASDHTLKVIVKWLDKKMLSRDWDFGQIKGTDRILGHCDWQELRRLVK